MAMTETRPETLPVSADAEAPTGLSTPSALERLLGTGDHKVVGRIFMCVSLLAMAVDLALGALVSLQASQTDALLDANLITRLTMAHPVGLVLCGAIPFFLGLAIYLVPLQVGSPTIAFPRAAAMSLWSWVLGTVLSAVAVAANGSYGGESLKMSRLGHVSVGLLLASLIVGSICVATTVLSHRAAGMSLDRVPFFSFSMLVSSVIWVLSLPVLLAVVVLYQIQRPSAATLASVAFPAMEWFFHQPTVFMFALPVLGIFLDIASSASSERVSGYGIAQAAIGAAGLLSFGAWAQSALARDTAIFGIGAIAFALPVVVVLGAGLDTLRRGSGKPTPALVAAGSSIVLLLVAAVTGAVGAVLTLGDGNLSEFATGGFAAAALGEATNLGAGIAVGQFYLVVAAGLVGGLAALAHWSSRIWSNPVAGTTAGPIALVGMLGGLLFGLPHVVLGFALPNPDVARTIALVAAIGGFLAGTAAFAGHGAATLSSLEPGSPEDVETEGTAELQGGTLEWLTASPAPQGNFSEPLAVVSSPYPLFDGPEEGDSK